MASAPAVLAKTIWERTMADTIKMAGRGLMAGAAALGIALGSAMVRADESGEKVYLKKCVMCHGADGKGKMAAGKATKTPDLCSDEGKKAKDAEWTEIIVKGKNKMPRYDKKLTAAEIKAVITYMRSLCKK